MGKGIYFIAKELTQEELIEEISRKLQDQPPEEKEKVNEILNEIGISNEIGGLFASIKTASRNSIDEDMSERISKVKDKGLRNLLLKLALVGTLSLSGVDAEAATKKTYPDNSSSSVEYVIQKGDNLYNLEKVFGIEHGVLQSENPGLNPTKLSPGKTKIKVPKKGEKLKKISGPDNSKGPVEYTIQSGDTFEKLEKKFSLELGSLKKENPDIDPGKLIPGKTKIKVPQASEAVVYRSGIAGVYLSRPGDTLKSISEKLNWSLDVLKELNPGLKEEDKLKDKQQVKTFDEDRLIRAFISVETGVGAKNEKKRDTESGDKGKALGSCQWHRAEFLWAGGKDIESKDESGKKIIIDGRTSREISVNAFRNLLLKYSMTNDILTVQDVLVKAKWNKHHGKKEYEDAYLNDSGAGIPLK